MLNRIKVEWKMWTGGFAFSGFTYLQNKLDTVTNKPSPGTPLRIYLGEINIQDMKPSSGTLLRVYQATQRQTTQSSLRDLETDKKTVEPVASP